MKSSPVPELDSHDRRILLNTCYGHFMSHFNMLVFPALVLPLAAGLGIEMAQVLALSFWMYLLFGLTALFWGIMADRFGARRLLFIFFLGTSLSSIGAALWLDSPAIFAFALAALGLFSGIYHPVGLGLISKEMSRVSIGMGYNGMFGSLGLGHGTAFNRRYQLALGASGGLSGALRFEPWRCCAYDRISGIRVHTWHFDRFR